MGPSGQEIRPYPLATNDQLSNQVENIQNSYHGNDSEPDAIKTGKDFVKEWLWRRSEHNQTQSTSTSDNSTAEVLPSVLLSPDVTPKTPSMNPSVRRSQQEMDGQNLNYVLNCLESRSSSEDKSWTPSDYGSYYSQRSLLNSYHKDKCQWSGYCKAFVVIAILVLVAWGIAVPLYFTVGPGILPWDTDDPLTTNVESQVARVIGNEKPKATVLTSVNCSMRIINEQYTHYLQNKYSSQFQSLRLKIESSLAKVFHEEKYFDKAVVTSFSPGSVVVQFVLLFNKKRPDIKEYTHHVLVNHLMTHWSMLAAYRIDLGSIKVKYISNKCAESNGGCSHICVWTLLGEGYECQCPQSYTIMADARTCLKTVLHMAAHSTTNSPCGVGHFVCKSGNCIPQQWVCDGVHDCLMGEDETHNVCGLRRENRYIPEAPRAPIAMPQLDLSAAAAQLSQDYAPAAAQLSHDYFPAESQLSQHNPTVVELPTKDFPTQDVHPFSQNLQDQQEKFKHLPDEKHQVPKGFISTVTEPSTSKTTPITLWEKQKPTKPAEFTLPGLEMDMNGSKLKDNGKIKDPSSNSLFRRFKFFG